LIFRAFFWITVNGNFMDICVLEWCKLFGDSRGKHSWQKVVSDPELFYSALLHHLSLTEADFKAYIDAVRDYRDKFVAHLDSAEIMRPPVLDVMKGSTAYLYDYLLSHEDKGDYFTEWRSSALFFEAHQEMANQIYRCKR